MLFTFLKYIRPTWYYNLRPTQDYAYFPTIEILEEKGFKEEKDQGYISEEAQERDLAWRAFQQGFINTAPQNGIDAWTAIVLPVEDEYRFFRKNFHKLWMIYVLIIRLITFHNPFRELHAFWRTRNVKRLSYVNNHFNYPTYDNFKSSLLEKKPFISVVIPTLNRYEYLNDVFKDLELQTYTNFEVIVVDQTDNFRADFYKGWNLDLKFWFQEEKALWKARNEAIKSAKGEYILLYDDDSLVDKDWIEHHLKTLDFFDADLSSGVSLSTVGAEIPENYSYFCWSSQLDTGNVLLKKKIFEEIGLFDRQFEKQRMGDGEFGLRAYLNGYKNISNPHASRAHLKVGSGGLREMGSWDAFRPRNLLAPRPIPSVLYLFRKYFGRKRTILAILKTVPQSVIPYKYKKNKKMLVLGVFISLLLFPFVVLQVLVSWRLSSRKLREGAMIGGWGSEK